MANSQDIAHLTPEEHSNLKKRYLIWFYKTTREALDRIDRKFTQLYIDRAILKQLYQINIDSDRENWDKLVTEFEEYINKKERDAIGFKYTDAGKSIRAEYLFLKTKFRSIEKIIVEEFGLKELRLIRSLYEQEMEKRIIEEKEHR